MNRYQSPWFSTHILRIWSHATKKSHQLLFIYFVNKPLFIEKKKQYSSLFFSLDSSYIGSHWCSQFLIEVEIVSTLWAVLHFDLQPYTYVDSEYCPYSLSYVKLIIYMNINKKKTSFKYMFVISTVYVLCFFAKCKNIF